MDILQSEKPIFIIASKISLHPKYNRSMRIIRILKIGPFGEIDRF